MTDKTLYFLQEVLEHTEKAGPDTLYVAASRDFGQARQILESVQVRKQTGNIQTFLSSTSLLQPSSEEDFSPLITINKNNFVAASVLARDKSRGIDFDFSLHINFPTVKLA